VGGHQFVQKGQHVIDSAADKISNPRRIEVRFDSREYFELIAKYPKTLRAFKGARYVILAVGDTVYEVS
jgi:hypothetical protein